MTATGGEAYRQKIVYARANLWLPFWVAGIAAHLRGSPPAELFQAALGKLRTLHPLLAGRVHVEENGTAWLTTEGVGMFPLDVRPRRSSDDWIALFLEQERRPFAFGSGPLARFFLLRDAECADIVAIAPHVVCDGYSTAQVMTDLVQLLNEPGRQVRRPVPPPPLIWQNVPHSRTGGLFLRGMAHMLDHALPHGRSIRDVEEYEDLHRRYWSRRQHALLAFELDLETSGLASRCRQRGVSVTGALVAAFLLAQAGAVPPPSGGRHTICLPVNIRDWMAPSPGNAVGLYASSVDIALRATPSTPFWELARQSHDQIRRALSRRTRVLLPLALEEVHPAFGDGLVEALCTDHWSGGYRLLTRMARLRDVTHSLVLSNLGRKDLVGPNSPYRLDALRSLPPLGPQSRMMLGVVTVGGRLQCSLRYRQAEFGEQEVVAVRDRALGYLLGL